METKTLADLMPDPKNPRRMSDHDGASLKRSIESFGDLSSIVFNIRTGQLVGGHQRLKIMKELPADTRIEMIAPYPSEPDDVGTVGHGFVIIGNKKYAYREVDWPEHVQHAANIAANRIQGEFDLDMLAELNQELGNIDPALLILTGQKQDELEQLQGMAGIGDGEKEPPEPGLTLRIKCDNDEQLTALYTELKGRGLNVSM